MTKKSHIIELKEVSASYKGTQISNGKWPCLTSRCHKYDHPIARNSYPKILKPLYIFMYKHQIYTVENDYKYVDFYFYFVPS